MSSGTAYVKLIASYIHLNFGHKELYIYEEVRLGKSIIGKDRRVDLLIMNRGRAFAIECKFQEVSGTADEKIPYALADLRSMKMGGCLVYCGEGFSEGVVHHLKSAAEAAYCKPEVPDLKRTRDTVELDHLLAMHFGWWDEFTRGRERFKPDVEFLNASSEQQIFAV